MSFVNKDTKIYCSFSSNPGNNGCLFFNKKFEENNINAIYKSFYSNDIKKSVEAVRTLGISGFAVSMPFKFEVIQFVDEIDPVVREIGAANTVTNVGGILKAYNTDWIGAREMIKDLDSLTILGNGGFSKAVQYACKILRIPYNIITRENWGQIEFVTGPIFNATPEDVKHKKTLIDGRPFTDQGRIISEIQAKEQYTIYINETM